MYLIIISFLCSKKDRLKEVLPKITKITTKNIGKKPCKKDGWKIQALSIASTVCSINNEKKNWVGY